MLCGNTREVSLFVTNAYLYWYDDSYAICYRIDFEGNILDYLGNPSSEKCHITLHLEILKTVVEVNDHKEIALLHGRK